MGPEFLAPHAGGYSQAVTVPAGGRFVYVAGQVAMDEDGSVPEGWEQQTRLTFENVGRTLALAGATWSDVIKTSYYVVDVAELELIRAIRNEYIDTARPPTSTLIQVAGLFRPGFLIEIDAVAWLP